MGTYLRLLRVPRLGPLLAAMTLGRLSIGINGLAIVLYLREERGGYGIAGLVAGALALGSGVGAPVNGRLIDRLGRRMLVPIAALHAVGLVALVLLGKSDLPGLLLALTAFATGACVPPTSSVLRAMYPELLRGHDDLTQAAFGFDSVVTELLFVLGPLVVAVLVATVAPSAALLLAAVTVLAGNVLFLVLIPGRAGHGRPPAPADTGLLGALASPGIRTLVLTMVPFGAAFGVLEVAIPAFARGEGHPELAGVLIAGWSIASAAGGLVYGVRVRRRALADIHLLLALSFPLAVAPLVAGGSIATMALLLIPAGLPIAPLIASRNELAGAVAPRGAETEAYAWVIMSLVGGLAFGAGIGGVVVDESGWRMAVVVAVGLSLAGAAGAVQRRNTLREAVASGGQLEGSPA